jgi:hypothetical protein
MSNSRPVKRRKLSVSSAQPDRDELEDLAVSLADEPPLCKFCSTMFLDLENVRQFRSTKGMEHCTPNAIKEQAQAGCQLCGLIKLRFDREWAKLEQSRSKFRLTASNYQPAKAEKKKVSGFDSLTCRIDGEERYSNWSAFTPPGMLYSHLTIHI